MSINNIFDFDSRIDFLLESYEEDIIGSIQKQGDFMNSDIINSNFDKIESYLNDMYEKIRVLEEVIDYAKIYVNNEIDSTITECRDLLNEIEGLNDSIFDGLKNYTIINVPLNNNDAVQYSDRDGTMLKTCEIYNNLISLSGTVKNSIEIKDVSVKRKEQVYESNYKDLINGEAYRTFYFLDGISKNGVTETIQFDFKEPKDINSIKIKLSNCNIVNIIYVHEDNTETIDSDISKGIIPLKTVKGVKLTINSTNYTAMSVAVATTEENKFEDLNKAWASAYEEMKDQDLSSLSKEYKLQMCDYLEQIYLKEVK